MNKKSFTLIEIIIVTVVLGILVTIGFPQFLNAIEDSRARVCKTNLEALKVALDSYVMDNDATPASLSQIPKKYFDRAYASVVDKHKDAWKIRLAYMVVDWQERGLAYANPVPSGEALVVHIAGGSTDSPLLHCPSNPANTVSYGINNALKGLNSKAYNAALVGIMAIADSDSTSFTSVNNLPLWHKRVGLNVFRDKNYYAQGIKIVSTNGVQSSEISKQLYGRVIDSSDLVANSSSFDSDRARGAQIITNPDSAGADTGGGLGAGAGSDCGGDGQPPC